jgi:hypothetical protein
MITAADVGLATVFTAPVLTVAIGVLVVKAPSVKIE